MRLSRTVFDCGEVLIIGAGAAGLLVARHLSRLGVKFAIVEAVDAGAGQSNHSHGYLHQGYIYQNPQPQMVASLRRGAALWHDLIAGTGIPVNTKESFICFTNAFNAEAASDSWRSAGLPVEEAGRPLCFDQAGVCCTFRSSEETLDFTAVLSHLCAAIPAGSIIKGSAIRLHARDRQISAVDVKIENKEIRLCARAYVIAAGRGNPTLLRTVTRYRGRSVLRTSYMLVVQGDGLPSISAVFPEQDVYGLFLVSRSEGDVCTWLVSDYISNSGLAGGSGPVANWVTSIHRHLCELAPVVRGASERLRFGVYDAPKAELRDDPSRMQPHGSEHYGFSNLLAVSPTKLTLAPVLASETVESVRKLLISYLAVAGDPVPAELTKPDLQITPERWRSVVLKERAEFFKEIGARY